MFRGFAVRKLMRTVVSAGPKRSMGGHAKPPPSGGIDGAIRKIFPEDYQVSMLIVGGYFGLYLFSKLLGSGKKKEAAAAPAVVHAAAGASDGEIPSSDSPAFAEWISTPGNIEKALS